MIDPYEDWPTEPVPDIPNKILLPICGAILLFGAWYFGYIPVEAIKAILFHD